MHHPIQPTDRHEPVKDEIFNPFSAQFHKGFNLPNSKFNGRHRIDIRCYARTPMGANNMVWNLNLILTIM